MGRQQSRRSRRGAPMILSPSFVGAETATQGRSADIASMRAFLASKGGGQMTPDLVHAFVFVLLPEMKRWNAVAVPMELRRLVAQHLIAAGVVADSSPEDARLLI